MVVDLTVEQYLMVFGYLFLPIAIFAVLLFGSVILSNRMGGKNKLIVFFVRLILVSGLLAGLFFYFNYFINIILIGG
jgi:hypothetical protein